MKKTVFFLLSLAFFTSETPADMRINFQNNFGYTIVDVGDAMDIPDYNESTGSGLVDWDQFNYKGLIQLLFDKSENVVWGPEIGINRLYYWEKKYKPFLFDPRWYWDTIWTGHIGGIICKSFAENYYVLTGASLHIFFNESGATVGLPFAVGHELPISDTFTIPIEFRVDVIFGSAVPIAIGGGVGLKYKFGK
ncbi:hypothetical protein ACFL60_06305 [Candidatus Omnitrophota bacterium]